MKHLALTLVAAACAAPVFAATPAQVEYAVQGVLAREGALFVDFDVGEDGRAHVLFGRNEPAWRVEKTVKALQSHPDIPGLVWTQLDTDFCPIR
ncbi:MAG: hypothetical protein LDL19_02610 [Thiobacillus sp.]|nr:hypothetical protein [Thiobacillus sp.]